MERNVNREALLRSVRSAIKSVRRSPIKINWSDDGVFYIELRFPKLTERLDFYLAAQLALAGFGGADRLLALIKPWVISFRLPVETEDGQLKQAVFNAEPLEDIEFLELTPDDIFSDDSEFCITPMLIVNLITELMELTGRTQTVATGVSELMELFPAPVKNAADLLEQTSS